MGWEERDASALCGFFSGLFSPCAPQPSCSLHLHRKPPLDTRRRPVTAHPAGCLHRTSPVPSMAVRGVSRFERRVGRPSQVRLSGTLCERRHTRVLFVYLLASRPGPDHPRHSLSEHPLPPMDASSSSTPLLLRCMPGGPFRQRASAPPSDEAISRLSCGKGGLSGCRARCTARRNAAAICLRIMIASAPAASLYRPSIDGSKCIDCECVCTLRARHGVAMAHAGPQARIDLPRRPRLRSHGLASATLMTCQPQPDPHSRPDLALLCMYRAVDYLHSSQIPAPHNHPVFR